MGVGLDVPDHATLPRRSAKLEVSLARQFKSGAIDPNIDRSGLEIVGKGEWSAANHHNRGRRGVNKLYFGVDAPGEIVAQMLTDSDIDDETTGGAIIERVRDSVRTITVDATYGTGPVYAATESRGAVFVVPPFSRAGAPGRGRRSMDRDQAIKRVKELGRRKR